MILGHRGDPEHHPENTLAGFLSAITCGADGVELDVQVSSDGVPAVIHDDTLLRTAGIDRRVDAVTWPELDALGIPRLDSVLQALPGRIVAVELKPPYSGHPHLARDVVHIAGDGVMLLSFDHAHLRAVAGQIPTAALVRERPADALATLDACGANALALWWEHIDANLCAQLRHANKDVIAWTVDDPAAAESLTEMGVAVLISNRPCTLRRV